MALSDIELFEPPQSLTDNDVAKAFGALVTLGQYTVCEGLPGHLRHWQRNLL